MVSKVAYLIGMCIDVEKVLLKERKKERKNMKSKKGINTLNNYRSIFKIKERCKHGES